MARLSLRCRALTRGSRSLQDSSTGVLYGATSESVLASSSIGPFGQLMTLGGTGATFVVTFQLPGVPPTGSLSVLQVLWYNSSNIGTTNSFYSVNINAMSVLSVGGSGGAASGYSNISGYVSGSVSATTMDAVANTSTAVGTGWVGLPQYVPKLFGGSWVTVAVSVSSTGNLTLYVRNSVVSSSSTFGASMLTPD